MKLTKLEHSGLIIEQNNARIICDPVEFEHKLPELENVTAIIITHKHGDHYQLEVLQRIIAQNPAVRIFVPRDFELDEIDDHLVEKVEADVEWNLENFNLKFFGKNHAEIVAGSIPCANLGVVINDKIFNPGDSFDKPAGIEEVELLCVPSTAPWLKIAESMEYIKAVKPKEVIPMHNALLSTLGNQIINDWLKKACDEIGAKFIDLGVGEDIEL